MKKTTRNGLKERQNAPLILSSSGEPFNSTRLENYSNVNSPIDTSKSVFHWGSGYNSEQFGASMSGRIFVLSKEGKPLTPCKPQKARKLILGKVAVVVWNKFNQFGIQMLVETREFVPETKLGCDFGTKFEGYSVVVGKENLLNVMWKLPDKKKLVKKLEDRKRLRRARRFRNCRRRECRFDNRNKDGFIAPSQLIMVNSRLKAIKEFLKYYPICKVVIEDVKFNHRDKRYGRNFSTIEIGKEMIYDYIKDRIGEENLNLVDGFETKEIRDKLGLNKGSNKSAEHFNSHCVDSFAMIVGKFSSIEPNKNIIIVDDKYRCVRRRLYDSQFNKKGIREKYSTGNFKGISKGCICEFGQMAGGTKNYVYIYNWDNKRNGKVLNKVNWLSHHFKTKDGIIPPLNKSGGLLKKKP